MSLDSARSYLELFAPELAQTADWQGTDIEVRQRLEELLLASSSTRAELIASLQRVFLMGSSGGDRAMIAACGSDVLLRQELSARPNPHERALWLLGHHPDLFDRAEDICQSDHRYGGRNWSGFIGPRDTWPDLAGEPLDLFKARIETRFRQFDGSGARIVVEAFERGPASIGRYGEGRVFQLVAYLEGLPATSTAFGDGGIVRRNVRPAFEVALIYAPETGVIDIVGSAGRPLREAVAKAFVEELFPQGADIAPVRLREVALAALARPSSFPVDPEDGIEGVRLTALRIEPTGVA